MKLLLAMRAYVAQGLNNNDPLSTFAFTTTHPVPEHPPTDTSVLVKIAYASVNPADLQYVNGVYEHAPAHPMPRFPCPLGVDGAGVVVAVGSTVGKFKIGEHVVGLHQRMDEGTWAEIASFEEHELAIKPKSVCWQLAAAVPVAGVTALSALLCCPALKEAYEQHSTTNSSSGTDASTASAGSESAPTTAASAAPTPGSTSATPADVNPMAHAGTAAAAGSDSACASRCAVQSVLILGASGGVGSFAVLLAKHYFGIPLVLATCSGRNADYVRGLGADVVIDYTQQDVAAAVQQALQQQQESSSIGQDGPMPAPSSTGGSSSSDGKLDLVLDNVGGAVHMTLALGLLSPCNGLYVTSVPLADPSTSSFGSVLSFFARLGWRKALHALAPARFPAVAFNGASPNGDKVQRLVDWLAAAEYVGSCLLRLTEFDLQDTGQALAAMQSRRVVGKLVLRVHGNL